MRKGIIFLSVYIAFAISSCVKEDLNEFNGHNTNTEGGIAQYSSFKVVNVQLLSVGFGSSQSIFYSVKDQEGVTYHSSITNYISANDLPEIIELATNDDGISVTDFSKSINITFDNGAYGTLTFIPNNYLGQSGFQLKDESESLIARINIDWR